MKELSKDEMIDAIKQGVKEAFHEMMESGDGFTGPIRTKQVMEAINQGVYSAMPFSGEIEKAIKDGVMDSFPYPSQILEAIANGQKDR